MVGLVSDKINQLFQMFKSYSEGDEDLVKKNKSKRSKYAFQLSIDSIFSRMLDDFSYHNWCFIRVL